MKAFLRNNLAMVALGVAGVLAAAGGAFAAVAITAASGQPPTETVTVNVGQGATGPQGPAGPAGATGPAGAEGAGGADQCPPGSTFKAVILNAPGGQTEIWTCVAG
jgi:hypothetical protein